MNHFSCEFSVAPPNTLQLRLLAGASPSCPAAARCGILISCQTSLRYFWNRKVMKLRRSRGGIDCGDESIIFHRVGDRIITSSYKRVAARLCEHSAAAAVLLDPGEYSVTWSDTNST